MVKKYLKPIIEITLINFIIYLVFFRLQPNPGIYFQLNPHPLIFVVMGFALFYGNLIGVMTTLITLVFYVVLFYEVNGELFLLLSDFRYFKNPLLFLWVTTLVGTVVDNHREYEHQLKDSYKDLKQHYKLVKRNYRLSKSALEELEDQIIDADMSIIALYDIAQRLKELEEEEIMTEVLGIFTKYLKASQIIIHSYYPKSNFLRLKVAMGVDIGAGKISKEIEPGSIEERVIHENKVFRYSDAPGEGVPILIGPIIKDQKVIGVISIKEMDFNHVSNYAYTLFTIILDWVNLSLDNIRIVEEQRDSIYYEDTEVLVFDMFKKYLKIARRRQKEYGLDYFLLTLQSKDDPLEESVRIKKVIRDIDRVSFNDHRIYVLFPATTADLYGFLTLKVFERLGETFKIIDQGPKKGGDSR